MEKIIEAEIAKAAKVEAKAKAVKPAVKRVASTRSATPASPAEVVADIKWDKQAQLDAKSGTLIFDTQKMKALSNADADKAIAQIASSGKSLKRLAHTTACGIMLHYVEHGDFTKIHRLLAVVQNAMSRRMATGLVQWVEHFSSLKYDKDAKVFRHTAKADRLFNLNGDKDADPESDKAKGAGNIAFWSGNFGDQPPHVFDAEAYIATSIKRMVETLEREMKRKLEAKNKVDAKRIKVDHDNIKALQNVAKNLHISLADTPAANRQAA